ncbi:hypothetical protein ACXC9Q_28640 [Kribbella sp. CWNU-51]
MEEFEEALQEVVKRFSELRDTEAPENEERTSVMLVLQAFPYRF